MAKLDQVNINETTYEIVPEIAPLFDATKAYAANDCVIKDAVLYRFTVAHAAGAWIGSDAEEVTVSKELTDLKADLSNVEGEVFTEELVWNEVALEYESGKFWSRTGVNDHFNKAKRSTNLVSVTPGETLKITTNISTNVPGVVYFNSSTFSQSTFVGYDLYELDGKTVREYTDAEVTVPAGAEYVVLQGRPLTTAAPFALKKSSVEYVSRLDEMEENAEEYTSDNDFEVENLARRCTNAENKNSFAWAAFDKSYFVFIHDDTNAYLEDYAAVFHSKGVPMGAATIPANLNDAHLATLQQMVADGGEVLAHYNASPTEESTDVLWMACTGAVKKALESYGFEVHGLIKANGTASSTDKGQKYCQRYYDYADNHLGKTEQFNFPRTLMLNYDSLSAFKTRIDALENVNGIHAFGFHGGRQDEAWITAEAFAEIIDYINAKPNCEITTYYNLWQTFGSSVLEERIKALEF